MDKEREFQKARDYSFLLLKFRLRSEQELYGRLRRKKFSEAAAKRAVAFLKEKGFLNDREFARAWIASRIGRPFGLRRIALELEAKGVDKELIASEIEELKGQGYSEDEVVSELVEAKRERMKRLDRRSAKRRLYAFLLRRGFSADAASQALNRL